jgi:hypothetical protein
MRGTFAGLGTKAVIDHIREPWRHQRRAVADPDLLEPALSDRKRPDQLLGLQHHRFFRADPRYLSTPDVDEFKAMVDRFHEAGLEVILDVVYNHTAEGNELGPTISFKGIDNASYYRLMPDEPRYYINDTGTGNTLNLSHPRVLQMVTDSLRYWVTEMHVDGFRFDLATILGARARRLRRERRVPRQLPPGPDPLQRQAHRRAVGLRSRRLSGRPFRAWLGRMERQVPRHAYAPTGRAKKARRPALATRRHRKRRQVQPARPPAVGQRQLHHRARWFHARTTW